jgi:hypothetical protein
MPSNTLDVPADVALCPYCASPLYLEVDEWDAETRQPTEGGAHIHCAAEAEAEDLACREGPASAAARQWCEMGRWHEQMPYVYWLPAQIRVYRLFAQHCRVLDAPNGETALVYVPPPVPPAEEMRRAGAAPLPGF